MLGGLALIVIACACGAAEDPVESSCSDGVKNGGESDIDCGGGCPACDDGAGCATTDDCASGVCGQSRTCSAPTCSDGVTNGAEIGIDCGGACATRVSGEGCVTGTASSMACTSYSGGDTFTVVLSWDATGGNAYVNYVTAYLADDEFNAEGVRGGSPVNVCVTAPTSQTFDLPLGRGYTWKIWRAYCVRDDACAGCGEDTVIGEGGPFGIGPDCS
jgi:hypothetical protein